MGKEGREGALVKDGRRNAENNSKSKGGKEGRREGKEAGELLVSVRWHWYMKEQNTIIESTGGMQQGHRDMCLFDDKEIKHEKDMKE